MNPDSGDTHRGNPDPAADSVTELPVRVPASFHDGLIYVEPVTLNGDTLRFFTDSGDASLIYESSVDRLSLATTSMLMDGQTMTGAWLPPFLPEHAMPLPLQSDGLLPVRTDKQMPPHHQVILGRVSETSPDDQQTRNRTTDAQPPDGHQTHGKITAAQPRSDGILGASWFAGRSWFIDYRAERLYVWPSHDTYPADSWLDSTGSSLDSTEPELERTKSRPENVDTTGRPTLVTGSESGHLPRQHEDSLQHEVPLLHEAPHRHEIPLHFLVEGGKPRYHFARIEAIVSSDTLSLVLKTGGHIQLDDATRERMGHDRAVFPAGLITRSVFKKWRERHPEWTVFENADTWYRGDVIRVPSIRIGTFETGPVHFAVRKDPAFDDWFSRFTDQPVSGTLGPDAFRDARIMINYPNSLLIFFE